MCSGRSPFTMVRGGAAGRGGCWRLVPTAGYFVAIEAVMSAVAACDVLRAPGLPLGERWAGATNQIGNSRSCGATAKPRTAEGEQRAAPRRSPHVHVGMEEIEGSAFVFDRLFI